MQLVGICFGNVDYPHDLGSRHQSPSKIDRLPLSATGRYLEKINDALSC